MFSRSTRTRVAFFIVFGFLKGFERSLFATSLQSSTSGTNEGSSALVRRKRNRKLRSCLCWRVACTARCMCCADRAIAHCRTPLNLTPPPAPPRIFWSGSAPSPFLDRSSGTECPSFGPLSLGASNALSAEGTPGA
ncbi:hypothetical protein PR003_g8029 [Phytophthora rubi]|uniref:Secreted protein n=1 Tax=Phytophthora rubi TaxID=129364 RepID=A0A6A3MVL1_9STRA|nr:hypothetical protein PR002_g6707 [Phytophthora rubi]KAE9039468.1 hypothetical protein PR001_g7487 [Phytophthora rubi]KAE9345283.1 hypothetical protein PR003_g8029 [Phytophthora rubi]